MLQYWQKTFNVRLEPYNLPSDNPPDYWIVDPDKEKAEWLKIDWMFTEEKPFKIKKMNENFIGNGAWENKVERIEEHFEKADIIPLDLRRLTNKNRAKLLSYVLSLTIEKRNKIKLIVGESE